MRRREFIFLGVHTIEDTPETDIGRGTRIWSYVHVGFDAVIGENCSVGDGVHVGPRVVIGNGCKIQNGAQLFEGVTLEDDVFIGPHVVFTNVLTPRAFINRRAEFKPTLVKRGASIGANATVLCGITIGEYAMVGAGAVVTKDVPPHTLVVGNPAHYLDAVCICGERLQQTHLADVKNSGTSARYACTVCAQRYVWTNHRWRIVEGPYAQVP